MAKASQMINRYSIISHLKFVELSNHVYNLIMEIAYEIRNAVQSVNREIARILSKGSLFLSTISKLVQDLAKYASYLIKEAWSLAMRGIAQAILFLKTMSRAMREAAQFARLKVKNKKNNNNKKPPNRSKKKFHLKPGKRKSKGNSNINKKDITSSLFPSMKIEQVPKGEFLVDFTNVTIEIIPFVTPSSPKKKIAYIEPEYSSTFGELIKRRQEICATSRWDIHRLFFSFRDTLENKIYMDTCNNGGIPFSFLVSNSVKIVPSDYTVTENSEAVFAIHDPKNDSYSLGTIIAVGAVVVVAGIALWIATPAILTAVAVGATAATAGAVIYIHIKGNYEVRFN